MTGRGLAGGRRWLTGGVAAALVVTPLGGAVKLTGAGQKTGQVHQRVLQPDQLELLEASPQVEPFDGDPLHFKLGVEAARLGLAYEYDPYFSLSIARVDPLPHQLEAVAKETRHELFQQYLMDVGLNVTVIIVLIMAVYLLRKRPTQQAPAHV